ncbi:major facilitator superfamily domain-containing protein [Hyaloraphidium curvatum]|nr:major facilitator superfamily domain-containing protein [Hyaloraphidium curvatum]
MVEIDVEKGEKSAADVEADVADPPAPPAKKPRSFWLLLVSLMLTLFLASLDATVVSTAIPTIARELDSVDQIAWIANGYLVTATALFPVWGRISDIFGRRPVILFATGSFFLASIICAVAPNITVLIVGRSLQGVGGGAIEALVAIVVSEIVAPAERGKFQGLTGAVFGLSSIIGPLIGGLFTEKVSWRWLFWINLPLTALAMVGIGFFLRLPRKETSTWEKLKQVDFAGVGTVLAGNVLLLMALTWGGNEYAWNSAAIITCLVLSGVLWAAFIFIEIRIAKNPIIPPHLFRIRNFVFANISNFALGFIMLGYTYWLPIWWQSVQDVSAFQSGVQFIPAFMSTVIFVIGSGVATEKLGRLREFIIVGMFLLLLGTLLTGLIIEVDWPYWKMALLSMEVGVGLGLSLATLLLAVQFASGDDEIGPGTSVAFFGRNLGGILAITIVSAVVSNSLPGLLKPQLETLVPQGLPENVIDRIVKYASGGHLGPLLSALPPQLAQAVGAFAVDGLNTAIKRGFIAMVPVAAIGFIASWFIKHVPFRKDGAAVKLEA